VSFGLTLLLSCREAGESLHFVGGVCLDGFGWGWSMMFVGVLIMSTDTVVMVMFRYVANLSFG
jgi:hypothetical protein